MLAVLGLGRTGRTAALALARSGAKVVAWDDGDAQRAAAEKELAGFDVEILSHEAWSWAELEAMVLSPGIPHLHPAPHAAAVTAKINNVPIVGDLALLDGYAKSVGAKMLVITGTNGKSTTTGLIGHAASLLMGDNSATGGNIGTGVLSLPALGEGGLYVIEASSYQLELAPDLAADVAVLVNISPDHLDRHGGMDGYVRAKRRVFEAQGEDACAIISRDDPYSAELFCDLKSSGKSPVGVSVARQTDTGVSVANGCLFEDRAVVAKLDELSLVQGPHNAQNIAMAYASLRALGFSGSDIIVAMKDFSGLAHRMEMIATIGNVDFVNDSKATNAEAVAPALASRDNIYWIAGGVAKEGGISGLSPYFDHVRKAYLIGEAANDFETVLHGRVETALEGNLSQAVDHAYRDASSEADACVLLSPACASFDQFTSFEARGEAFREAVLQLSVNGGAA